jgi:mannose-6-phosphate isomerase-like protein (cupin superfamily)
MKTRYREITPYITKDKSIIRELLHPNQHGAIPMSLAEAIIPAGVTTSLHKHHTSTEYYHVTQGRGEMRLGEQLFDIAAGDSVCIQAGQEHQVKNSGATELVILCVCNPPYDHDDTELV